MTVLRRLLNLLIIGVLGLVVLVPVGANASSQITGTATQCTSFNACTYTIAGGGSARTNALVVFTLPGEAMSTTSQTYTFQNLGHTGTTYHIQGSFTAVDANNGKVVFGVTDDYIIQTPHCFRSCSYTYTLVSGTITFTLTGLDSTTTSLACNPGTFWTGHSTTCTVTVTDQADQTNYATGSITFGISTYGAYGTFTPSTCTLLSGSCSVTFTPSDNTVGYVGLTASYPGDGSHYISSGKTTIDITYDE